MALINCPECGKEISDKAIACPNCWCPIYALDSVKEETILTKESNKIDFPELPLIMNIGSQITNWGFDAAIQDCYYCADINNTNYIKDGKASVLAHTNGITIMRGIDFFHLSYQQIISMNYISHKELSTENKSVVGRAVVGGLLLGPLGAIVGGMSGIGTKTKTLGNYYFAINFYDVYTHSIQTILLITKDENQRFIERCEKEKNANNTPSSSNFVCNVLDENGTISDQKVLEALKVVGVSKVANAVAYIDGCGIESAIVKVRKIAQNNNVDVSKYQSQGCMITILILISSILTACSIACL